MDKVGVRKIMPRTRLYRVRDPILRNALGMSVNGDKAASRLSSAESSTLSSKEILLRNEKNLPRSGCAQGDQTAAI